MTVSKEEVHPIAPVQRSPLMAIVYDWIYVLLGLSLLALGVAITVSTPWGTQPWDVLHLGLARLTGLSLGRVSQLIGGVVVLITLALRGKGITWLTLINVLLIGFEVDILLEILPYVEGVLGLVYLELGVIIVGVGMALYLTPEWGAGPRDSLMLALHQKTHIPIFQIRIALDSGVVIAGWLLGGPVGLGTLVAAFTTGPWAQLFLRWAARLRHHLLKQA